MNTVSSRLTSTARGREWASSLLFHRKPLISYEYSWTIFSYYVFLDMTVVPPLIPSVICLPICHPLCHLISHFIGLFPFVICHPFGHLSFHLSSVIPSVTPSVTPITYQSRWRRCWRSHHRLQWSCQRASDHQAGFHAPSSTTPSKHYRFGHRPVRQAIQDDSQNF